MRSREFKSVVPVNPAAVIAVIGMALLLAGIMIPRTSEAESGAAMPAARRYALDSAWSFACTINDYAKSRAINQQRVAIAFITAGDIDDALSKATSIEGWRVNMVQGEAAAAYARQGRKEEAGNLISGLATNAFSEGEIWSTDRIRLKADEARAWLARPEELEGIRTRYNGSELYAVQSVAYGALGMLNAGDADGAIQMLQDVTDLDDYDNLVWHTEGYLLLADSGRLNPVQLAAAICGATNSVQRVPGNRQLELLIRIAEVSARQNMPSASNHLETASATVVDSKFAPHILGPLVANVMRLWAVQGDGGKFDQLAAIASEVVVSDQISITERPALYGLLGEAYLANGQPEKALDAFRKGFAETARQVNPRPRAISAIDLCLSMARSGFDTHLVKQELTELLGTF